MPGFIEQLSSLEKVIALVGAAGLAYTSVSAGLIQNDLSAQKLELEAQAGQLARVAEQQNLDLAQRKEVREASKEQNVLTREIFEEFVKAITDQITAPPQRLDRLEGVLVLTYAIPDPRQQEGMGRAVQKAMERIQAPEVAARVKEASFDAEELVVRASAEQRPALARTARAAAPGPGPATVRWSNYDFDVFWCDGVPQSADLQARAGEILALRSLDPSASGRWRPRPLPHAVNARPGYHVAGYQIRYSSADEKPLAEELKSRIEAQFPPAKVAVVATSQSTPWYLSVFACP